MVAGGKSAAAAAVSGLVLFGTTTSLLSKIVYELQGPSLDGTKDKLFRKPWAMTAIMFLGMSFCLPVALAKDRLKRQAAADRVRAGLGVPEPILTAPLLLGVDPAPPPPPPPSQARVVALLAIPTAFDLVATVLMNVGLLNVTASVYQMMRGAEMLFAALFAVTFLGRRLNRMHFAGLAACVAGIAAVGAASLLSGEGSRARPVTAGEMAVGMALIILSQAVQAGQLTFEDHFMSGGGPDGGGGGLNLDPLLIVGWEGVLGTVAMGAILLPLVSLLPGVDGDGVHEDTRDTMHMVAGSPVIATTLAVQMAALLAYNVSGMAVTGHLGAVFRTVLETSRTLAVWVVDLILALTGAGGGKLGESWGPWSWVQAAGFVVLVAGTLLYGRGDELDARAAVAAAYGGGGFGEEVAAGDGLSDGTATPTLAPGAAHAPGAGGAPIPAPHRRRSTSSSIAAASLGATPMSFRSTMAINAVSSYAPPVGSAFGGFGAGSGIGGSVRGGGSYLAAPGSDSADGAA